MQVTWRLKSGGIGDGATAVKRKRYGIIRGMEKTRPILYGVADYAMIRKKNGWFVDIVIHGGDCVLAEEVEPKNS